MTEEQHLLEAAAHISKVMEMHKKPQNRKDFTAGKWHNELQMKLEGIHKKIYSIYNTYYE